MLLIIFLIVLALIFVLPGIRVVNQYERGVVLRLGKFSRMLEPGLRLIIPYIDQLRKVDIRTAPMDIPKQEVMLAKTPGGISIRTLQTLEKISTDPAQKTVILLPTDLADRLGRAGK